MANRNNNSSSFIHFHEGYKKREREIMEQNTDIGFVKEFAVTDIEYFKRIFSEAERIDVHITWGFDEQQADPFNSGFKSEEFIRRLKRIIDGNPKEYNGKSIIQKGSVS